MAASVLDFSSLDTTTDDVTDQSTDTDVVDTDTDHDAGGDGSADAGDGGGDGAEADAGGEEKLDGRKGPQAIRNAVKAASDAVPEQAARLKEMANGYFREQAYKATFATPQEAASAKQLIESVGGVEGIAKFQERDQIYQAQDAMFEEGNPEVLDDFFEDFPDGAVALAPAYLDRLAKVNPEALSAAVMPHVVGVLQGIGFDSFLRTMHAESDPAKFKGLVEQLYNWFAGEHKKAGQLRQPAAKNPGTDRIKQQQTKLDQEREQLFSDGVTAKVRTSTGAEMSSVVDQQAKRYGWNDKQKAHYQKTLGQRVVDALNADETYKSQLKIKQSSKARTHDTVANHISGAFNEKLKDMAFDVATEIYGAPKGGKGKPGGKPTTGVVKPGTPKTAPGGGPILVSAQPSREQVDWRKPNAEELWIMNQAWLKSGRFVTWKD
jgi:hypothetical protein